MALPRAAGWIPTQMVPDAARQTPPPSLQIQPRLQTGPGWSAGQAIKKGIVICNGADGQGRVYQPGVQCPSGVGVYLREKGECVVGALSCHFSDQVLSAIFQ